MREKLLVPVLLSLTVCEKLPEHLAHPDGLLLEIRMPPWRPANLRWWNTLWLSTDGGAVCPLTVGLRLVSSLPTDTTKATPKNYQWREHEWVRGDRG